MGTHRAGTLLCTLLLVAGNADSVRAVDTIAPERALAIGGVLTGGRSTFPIDPIQHGMVTGQWRTPSPGDTVEMAGRTAVWREIRAREPGVFRDAALRGGYASITVTLPREAVMLLEASGHSMVYVNGEPRVGNPYGYGYVRLPARLREGPNELVFVCGRGELSVKLSSLSSPYLLVTDDATFPDLVPGDRTPAWAAVPVINATSSLCSGSVLEVRLEDGSVLKTPLPAIAGMSVRKVPFRIPPVRKTTGRETGAVLRLLSPSRAGNLPLATASLTVGVRGGGEVRKCTFLSDVDGSVQYFAVVPPRQEPAGTPKSARGAPALTMTCHGAGVEAIGQAASYAPKRGMYIVAPTNRRPFGFDWEEWGRMDAVEVLEIARRRFGIDPQRVYLTGHSMGGHGAWHLAVTFPDRFAAVGPSAGWVSFRSYAGGPGPSQGSTIETILGRAASGSDTLLLATNLKPLGVYILHGDADDNVPVSEARTMFEHLRRFHSDLTLHEQPGAGHWWGAPSDPGTGCVDWPAMFDLFQRRILPRSDETRYVDFSTVNPGVSSQMRWLRIHQQVVPLSRSSAAIRCDPVGRRFVGTTENVSVMELSLTPFSGEEPVRIELDGHRLTVPLSQWHGSVFLSREREGWHTCQQPPPEQKRPGRAGPFKEAFSHRFVLVYGTGGTEVENAWSRARARYDAETFWYRGNGSPDVVSDQEFRPEGYRDRSVILYGNADTNRAWAQLLKHCPVDVRRGRVRLGATGLAGDDLACLFCYPRSDSETACVAVVAGTGMTGMRLTDRAPYFTSGTAFPDLLVWTPRTLLEGPRAASVAGFFGNDWSVEHGDFAWGARVTSVLPSHRNMAMLGGR